MTRFAALVGTRGEQSSTDPRVAAGAMLADLARRAQTRPAHHRQGPCWLMQSAHGHDTAGVHTLGQLTLTGDLGLTDLADLRNAANGTLGDDPARWLLALWMRLGEGAIPHLNGVFAFALHDARKNETWVVRDRMGVRPVTYSVTADGCLVASDISTVVAGLGSAPQVDRSWVADFLSGQLTTTDRTARSSVLCLPPGHLLRIDGRGRVTRTAWYRLDATADPAPRDGAQALHAALRHATEQACQTMPTATLLSGGLDSSSLSLLSVQPGLLLPRPALSLRYADAALDEGRYIDAVLERADGGLAPVSLTGKTGDSLFDLAPLLDEQDQPVFAPGLTGNRSLYRAAQDLGCRGILDGHGGDEVIAGEFWNIARIAADGEWTQAMQLALRHARFTGESSVQAIAQLLAWQGRRGFGRLGRLAVRGPQEDPMAWRSLVDGRLVTQTDLIGRVRAAQDLPPSDPALPAGMRAHAALLSQPLIANAFDVMDRTARAAGVTPHYPFFDHRVVELCVWQSDAAKIAEGQPRSLLRRAMQGVLPEMVRMRRDKTDFIADFWSALRRDPTGRLAAFRQGPGVLEGWADPATLRQDAARIAASEVPDPETAFRIWRAVWLSAWLERSPAPFSHDLINTDFA